MENDLQKIGTACTICGGTDIRFFAAKNNCRLCRCVSCGLIFVWPLPADTAGIYSADYFCGAQKGFGYVDYDEDKAAMSHTFISLLGKIEKFLPAKGKLLDVGAATGYFLKKASSRGWETAGVEISEYAASKARAEGLSVEMGTLQNVRFGPGSFDAVTMWDVIEHLSDPKRELEKAHSVLKDGGILAINTPDAGSFFSKTMGSRWHLLVPPEHLFYFNSENLTKLLNDSGFKVLETNKIGKKFTLQYILQTLVRWQNISLWKKCLKLADSVGIAKLSISINLRDNFFVVAQKNEKADSN